MSRRISARSAITVLTVTIVAVAIVLIVAAVRQSLADAYAAAIPEVEAVAWTVGTLVIALSGIAAWTAATYLLQPISAIQRNLALAARTRALADSEVGELHEIASLRASLRNTLEELESMARDAEVDKRHMLGLFEAISEGIAQISAQGRFVHVNAAARNLLKLPHQPEGQSVGSLVRNVELRGFMERAARGEVLEPTEVVTDNRQLLVSAGPLSTATGEFAGSIVTVVDLTELKRLESVRRDFVANVSHELKTPLTSIRGYAETLLADELPRDAQLQFLEVIYKNATRIQRIVEELLDLSRLQSGGWKPDLQDVDVAAVARDVWASCAPSVGRKQINFSIAGDEHVLADPGGLAQVFTNLFENAIRYTPDGGAVHVAVSRAPANGRAGAVVKIEVRDNGIGIPNESIPRIFERFYRVDPARSRAEGGTGLGLSIVKHFVERMGGEVSAQSELGKGTSIQIRLPAGQA